MSKKDSVFWIITACIFVFLILPDLFMDGMFADGTQYAIVSKNLAEGRARFWFPFLSETWNKAGFSAFMEQPPLMYALQAPFFKLLGNSLYVERIYTLLTALFTAFFICKIWRTFADKAYKHLSWLPLVFWLSIPLMSWTYRQNMQENTMGMFTIMAIYFGMMSIYNKKKWLLYAIATGASIFLASFTKGIPGLFPLSIAGFAFLIRKQITFPRAFILTLIYIVVPVLVYSLLLLDETARESLTFYFNSRLLSRVETQAVVNSHLYMAGRLFLELMPSVLLLGILIFLSRRKKQSIRIEKNQINKGVLLGLTGLAGSLPLMLTLVQRGFYMSISFPCFALSFAFFAAPSVLQLSNRININSKAFGFSRWILALILITGIAFTLVQAGKPGRDKALLKDVYTMQAYLSPYQTISCDGPSYHNFPFQFYMLRYNDVYMEKSSRNLDYYIVQKNDLPPIPELYTKLELNTTRYDLYLKKGIDNKAETQSP